MTMNPKTPRGWFQTLVWAVLLLAGPRVMAQVEVRVSPRQAAVMPGVTRTFAAAREDGGVAQWVWRLEGGPEGATLDPVTGEFRAPQRVDQPVWCYLFATDAHAPGVRGVAAVLVTPTFLTMLGSKVIQGGHGGRLEALRADDRPADWAWEVVAGPPGASITKGDDFSYFDAPKVLEPLTFTLRCRDLLHPESEGLRTLRVVPSLLGLRCVHPEALPLRPGQRCDLEVSEESGSPLMFGLSWRLLEGAAGGALQEDEPGRAHYTAPRVASPTTVHVRVHKGGYGEATLALQVVPTIDLKATLSAQVLSGQSCLLSASLRPEAPGAPAPPAPPWRWDLPERVPSPQTSPLVPLPDGRARFTAPPVHRPTPFTVQVQDPAHPEDPARIRILVLPAVPGLEPGTEAVFHEVLPKVLGDDWLTPVPQATLLAGRLGRVQGDQASPFQGIQCLCRSPLGLNGSHGETGWLVGDRGGLHGVTSRGGLYPVSTVHNEVTAVAVHGGRAPGQPAEVAFAAFTEGPHPRGMVLLLRQGPLPLAGTLDDLPPGALLEVGKGAKVGFGRIRSLTWTDAGALDVVDEGPGLLRVRRIARDGQVSLLGRIKAPGPGLKPTVAWDPASGVLYGAWGGGLSAWRLPEGPWERLLGDHEEKGFEDQLGGSHGDEVLAGCLDWPGGLQLLGRYLFIADTHNNALRVFNLETRVLQTLVGSVYEDRTRLGPLGFAAPDRPAETCAALEQPSVFAIDGDGACVVAQGEALVHLDLSAFALPTPGPQAAPGAARPGPGDEAMEDIPAAAAAGPGRAPSRKRPASGPPEDPQRTPPQPGPGRPHS